MSINHLEKINELYVFVSIDEGVETILGMRLGKNGNPVWMPFICIDEERMESMKIHAKEIAIMTEKKVKLIRLKNREEIEEY